MEDRSNTRPDQRRGRDARSSTSQKSRSSIRMWLPRSGSPLPSLIVMKEATRPIADDVLVGDDGKYNLIGPLPGKLKKKPVPEDGAPLASSASMRTVECSNCSSHSVLSSRTEREHDSDKRVKSTRHLSAWTDVREVWPRKATLSVQFVACFTNTRGVRVTS